MIEIIKIVLQYIIIISFSLLTIIGFIQKDWNYGFLLNLSLTILYIVIYLHPLK